MRPSPSPARDSDAFSQTLVLAVLVGFKCLYLLAFVWSVLVWGNFDTEKFYELNARWPREGEPVFASHFATWDSAHYLLLSEVGYSAGLPSCAFYPLWPLLMRWLSPLSGGSCLATGMLLSNIFSLAAWVLFYRHTANRWGTLTARWSLAFLIAFPGALFF